MCRSLYPVRALVPFLFTLALPFGLQAQAQLDPLTRLMLADVAEAEAHGGLRTMPEVVALHGLFLREGSWHARAMALVDENAFDPDRLQAAGAVLNSHMDGLVTLTFPVERINELCQVPGLRYLETGQVLGPELEYARADTRADSVQAGLGDLPMGYDGTGVVVAVVDWGFDYTHPFFRDSTYNNLRLAKAWDQNKVAGPAPTGFDFGTEYAGMEELLAVGEDTLYVFGPGSHGTHVAGIAGGNGAGSEHVGMAPGAELLFVSLRRDAPSLIDGFNWIRQYAESVNKPFVVNMSFGSHLGPHDGTSLKNQGISQIAGTGRVFVGSAGNNGTNPFHLEHHFGADSDTVRTVVGFGNVEDQWGQAVPIWGSPWQPFSMALTLVDNGEVIHQTNFIHSQDDPLLNDTIVPVAGDTLIVRLAGEAVSPLNGKPNMRLELRRVGDFDVMLTLAGASGRVDLWNVVRMPNRYTNWGVPLEASLSGTVAGDNAYGLGEPAGVGPDVITVASHRAERFSEGGTMVYGHLSGFSSRGPTVDGRTKPDICGPGQQVRSSVNSFDPNYANASSTVEVNGETWPMAQLSGTSMSAPAVTGVVALILQANPYLSAAQVKEILKETARLDIRTGEIGPEGSLDWGWGKVDAMAAVLAAVAVTSVPEVDVEPDGISIFPNPSEGLFQVAGMEPVRVRVFNSAGQVVFFRESTGGAGTASTFSLEGQPEGLYLVELSDRQRAVFKRVVRR